MSHKNEIVEYVNVFDELKKRNSILWTLFNPRNSELINAGAQAQSPQRTIAS